MHILFLLFLEFFKIGILSIGGGYATMPFLYHIISDYGWYTSEQLSNMIAVSILTPGPVGINMATFAGFQTFGIIGAVTATLSIVLPSYIIVVSISKLLNNFNDNFFVKTVLYSLKPAGCGLLCAVGAGFFIEHIKSLTALIVFMFLFILSFKFKKNPLYYFLISGVIGVVLDLLK